MAKCFNCGHEGAAHKTFDGAPMHSVSNCVRLLKAERDELKAEVERLRAELENSMPLDAHEACCDNAARQVRQLEREACAQRLEERARAHPYTEWATGLVEGARLVRARGEGGEG